jgi:hypothetical protein
VLTGVVDEAAEVVEDDPEPDPDPDPVVVVLAALEELLDWEPLQERSKRGWPFAPTMPKDGFGTDGVAS